MTESGHYSWDGLIDYIKTQKSLSSQKKEEWNTERANFQSLLQEKDLIIKSLQAENKELLTRLAILEYTVRQDNQKTNKHTHHRIKSDQIVVLKPSHHKLHSLDDSQKPSPTHRPSQSYGGCSEVPFERVHIPASSLPEAKCGLKKLWSPRLSLKSHLDGVRGLHFVSQNILASASEDCTVKLWDCSLFETESECSESYLTLRGHAGPVLSIDGGQGLVFTGDTQGIIRSWAVPSPQEVEAYADFKNYCTGRWKAHSDCVWSIRYNAQDHAIISASSDNTVKLWKLPGDNSIGTPQCRVFSFPGVYNTPTACNWVPANSKYITVGYYSFITVFNVETSGFTKIPYAGENFSIAHQVNCIASSARASLTVTGHEDKRIRFFDLNSKGCIKDMVGHTDSVTDVAIDSSGYYMLSTGHDGSLRSWDLRNFHCLHEITINRKKYDESIFCLAMHPGEEMIAIGGADSVIKILEAKE